MPEARKTAIEDKGGGLPLLPSTAKGAINLHKGRQLGQLRLHEIELCAEDSGLAIEYVEVTACPASVPNIGELTRVLGGAHEHFLRRAELARTPIPDQRVGHFAE